MEKNLPRALVALLSALFLLTSCNEASTFRHLVPHADAVFAEQYVGFIEAKNFDAAEAMMAPQYQTPQARTALEQMAALFPGGAPDEVEVVSWNWHTNIFTTGTNGQNTLEIQYHVNDRWLLARITINRISGSRVIEGAYINKLPNSLQQINGFTFAGKSLASYFMLLAVVLVPLFALGCFVLCLGTRIRRRKWLWLILTLFGVAQVSLNWTNGAFQTNLFYICLFGTGWNRFGLYGPIILHASIPLGGIIFLWKRKQIEVKNAINTMEPLRSMIS